MLKSCIICCRQFPTDNINNSTHVHANDEVSEENKFGEFFQFLKRHLDSSHNVRLQLPHDQLIQRGLSYCTDCLQIVGPFCTLYQQMKSTEILLNWKVEQLRNIIVGAHRLPSRMKEFRGNVKQLETDDGIIPEEIIDFQKELINKCYRHLNLSFPRIQVQKCKAVADKGKEMDTFSESTPSKLTDPDVLPTNNTEVNPSDDAFQSESTMASPPESPVSIISDSSDSDDYYYEDEEEEKSEDDDDAHHPDEHGGSDDSNNLVDMIPYQNDCIKTETECMDAELGMDLHLQDGEQENPPHLENNEPNPGPSKRDASRRYRTVYTPEQLTELEKEFGKKNFLDRRTLEELVQHLSLSEEKVLIWFRNRRAKSRRMNLGESKMNNNPARVNKRIRVPKGKKFRGTSQNGQRRPDAVQSKIIELLRKGVRQVEISRECQVSTECVSRICARYFGSKRRHRTAYTPEQQNELEKAFEKEHYPTRETRNELVQLLSLSDDKVMIWFANRRQKEGKKCVGESNTDATKGSTKGYSRKRSRRTRTAFTTEQVTALEKEFGRKRHPDRKAREDLVQLLSLSEEQVLTWFSNRRQKEWKTNLEEETIDEVSVADSSNASRL